MIQRDPNHRPSAEECLISQRDKAFPSHFYTFLKTYIQRYAATPIISADDRVSRIRRDWPEIVKNLQLSLRDRERNESLLIIISLLTSSMRSLVFEKSKLLAVELLVEMSSFVVAEVVLDRVVPYLLHLCRDCFARVRAAAVRAIVSCVVHIESVPKRDVNTFPEYILPEIAHLSRDSVVAVRLAYAESITPLACTAARFLNHANKLQTPSDPYQDAEQRSKSSAHDAAMRSLHAMVQEKVVQLICDEENIVKQTLLSHGVADLCVFFGRQQTTDVLLSHIVTFLNDKSDWHLRALFFEVVVDVMSYVGWSCDHILEPLLHQVRLHSTHVTRGR